MSWIVVVVFSITLSLQWIHYNKKVRNNNLC
jgi:hypothetical protein